MKVRWLFACMIAACFGTNANAVFIIPTNQGGGGDSEVREFQIADGGELDPTVFANAKFGTSQELATRVNNTTAAITSTGDRSSSMFMKFDISQLPNHNSDPAFWANFQVAFRGYIRNTNVGDNRIVDKRLPNTSVDALQKDWERVKFHIRGLEPSPFKNNVDASGGYRYGDDDASAYTRVDRSGETYSSPFYEYNWDEGTGANANIDGIQFMSAPGITPHCTTRGLCDDAYGDTDVNNIRKTLGQYDDFNDDTRFLGTWQWPLPSKVSELLGYGGGANRYPAVLPMTYQDTNGEIEQLIFDAQDAGRSHITLIMNVGVNPTQEANGGQHNGNDFLNFNYLFMPKEMTTGTNDTGWDPDGSTNTTFGGIGSPFSCNGGNGTGGTSTNCNGTPPPNGDTVLRTVANNGGANAGAFSPQLIVWIPEPASAALLALGGVFALVAGRRRK
jgi:hypothetical protein